MDYTSALREYQTVKADTAAQEQGAHARVELLLRGALDRINMAKGHLRRQEVSAKGETIGAAIAILDGLRLGLDKERGGSIAAHLESLYDYLQRRLLEANLRNDASALDEAFTLLEQIHNAWAAIADAVRPPA